MEIDEKTLMAAVRNYLGKQRATLWARSFDLSQDESRRKAEDWLAKTIQEIMEPVGEGWKYQ